MSANDLPRGPEEGAPERKTREKPSQEQTDWSGSFSAYLEAIAPAWWTACAGCSATRSAASSPAW